MHNVWLPYLIDFHKYLTILIYQLKRVKWLTSKNKMYKNKIHDPQWFVTDNQKAAPTWYTLVHECYDLFKYMYINEYLLNFLKYNKNIGDCNLLNTCHKVRVKSSTHVFQIYHKCRLVVEKIYRSQQKCLIYITQAPVCKLNNELLRIYHNCEHNVIQ